jgi:hypothetical protein
MEGEHGSMCEPGRQKAARTETRLNLESRSGKGEDKEDVLSWRGQTHPV